MSTQAQIDANRANAQHSTGPKTPEGKEASSQNATLHAAYSQTTLIPGEDPAEFEKLLVEFTGACKPVGPLEAREVETLVDCQWKIRRLKRLEDSTIRLYTLTLAGEIASLETSLHLAFIYQYDNFGSRLLKRIPGQQSRMHSLYAKAMKELRRMQDARKAESEQQAEIAKQSQSAPAIALAATANSAGAEVNSTSTSSVAPQTLPSSGPSVTPKHY